MSGHVKSVQSDEPEHHSGDSVERRGRYQTTSHQEHAGCQERDSEANI